MSSGMHSNNELYHSVHFHASKAPVMDFLYTVRRGAGLCINVMVLL